MVGLRRQAEGRLPHVPFKILVVCTATSVVPRGRFLLRQRLGSYRITPVGISVTSAGVHANQGRRLLTSAWRWSAPHWRPDRARPPPVVSRTPGASDAHRSRLVTADMLGEADLILTADRGHRADLAIGAQLAQQDLHHAPGGQAGNLDHRTRRGAAGGM